VVSKSEGQSSTSTAPRNTSVVDRGRVRTDTAPRGPLRITETHHGSSTQRGIDLSNTDDGTAVLLPKDPDRSARRFRAEIQRRCSVEVAVIITDTFGRVWRVGVTDVAIGSAGVKPVLDLRGTNDATGRSSKSPRSRSPTRSPARQSGARQGRSDTVRDPSRLDDAYFGDGSIKEDALRRSNEDLFR